MSGVCTRCREGSTDFNRYRCNACYAQELHAEELRAAEEVRALDAVIAYYERADCICLLSRWRRKNASAKIRRLIAESLALKAHMTGGAR